VIAKNDQAHSSLTQQFKNRSTSRIYEALVHGKMSSTRGSWKSFLARHPSDRKKFASLRNRQREIISDPRTAVNRGKWAVTHWESILPNQEIFQQYFNRDMPVSFIRIRLETGRTHQIRVHFSEAGYPLVHDPIYGNRKKDQNFSELKRLCLHARTLEFDHPKTLQRMSFSVEWPEVGKPIVR
jgi:23S rRNA pseudouridine1911/1915/1917 synthase